MRVTVTFDDERLPKHPLYEEASQVGQSTVGTLKETTGAMWFSQVGFHGDDLVLVINHNQQDRHIFPYAEQRGDYFRSCPPCFDTSVKVHTLGFIFATLLLAAEWQRYQVQDVALSPPKEVN